MVAPAAIACAADLGEERRFRAGGVLGRELDLVGVLGCGADARSHALEHLRRLEPQLARHVQRARRDEDVDPRAACAGEGIGGGFEVVRLRACERGDGRAGHRAGDRLHALEVARRRDREAGLDHVYAEPLELRGDLGLLVGLQGDAGRLLAVAKGGVEDRDPAGWQLSSSSSRPVRGRTGGVVRSACALRGAWSKAPPRGGESRRRGGKSGRAQPPRVGLRNGCCARRSSLQVCKCCRAVPGLSSPSAIRSRTLTSSGPARTLLAMAFAANEIFAFLFLVARKPAC